MITLPIDIRWIDLLDIFIVSVLLYYILLWLQGTRAVPLVRGLILILFIYFLGKVLRLYTISWLFD
jgi:DNA integrity scanning protein DisA with diadenylate cyclase activity